MDLYEKKYKEVQKWIESIYQDLSHEQQMEAEAHFPELVESDNDRIRKELISFLQSYDTLLTRKFIVWLEKQGEQNLVDKVEPKFHKGDWVILTAGELSTTLQIVNVDTNKKLYWFNDSTYLPIVDEECLRLWTIQDAKDGDVLVFKNNIGGIIICKSPTDYDTRSYCRLVSDNLINKEESGWDSTLLVPATKEQRDALFTKMEEAGYEWNREDEQNLNACLGYIPDEFLRRWLTDIIYAKHDKSAWSEEDERKLEESISLIKNSYTGTFYYEKNEIISFLKSLKDRVLPKQEWSEDDERRINRISDFIWKNRKGDTDEIYQQEQDVNWLKSIKQRIGG